MINTSNMKRVVVVLMIMLLIMPQSINFANAEGEGSAAGKCQGRLLNPLKDLCYSCMYPITVGNVPIIHSRKFRDTPNPSSPICLCNRGDIPLVPGVSIGFWEIIRIFEAVRTPYCLVSLGGIKVMSGKRQGTFKKTRSEGEHTSQAFYNVHYYIYPPLFLLNLLTDFACMDMSSYDLAYLSELDPSHHKEKLANFMHPEIYLLSNPIAHMACTVDCIAATTVKKPLDVLFWCSGCQGNVYPFTGRVSGHIGGVASAQLLATRQLAKLHRLGLARKTCTSSSAPNGEICKSSYIWRIPKSQYRLQMTYPIANVSGGYSCNNIGMSDLMYSSGREFPYGGEDFAFAVVRKRNCCLF